MMKLRAFTEQGEADSRELRNRNQEKSSSSQMDPDTPRAVRRREPEDLSPHCKSHRALSPSPATSSVTTRDSRDVSMPAPCASL